MSHLFGFIITIGLLRACMWLLKVDPGSYFDDVALIIVVGGTACAAIITYPTQDLFKMLVAFLRIAKKTPESREATVTQLVHLAEADHQSRSALIEAAENKTLNPFLKDGIELVLSGFSREDIEDIMTERLLRDREREEAYGGLLRTISKYPPAFGLVGTVLGLVQVMRAVSGGADSAEVGTKMALALVATLYGLLFANFVLIPMSENLYNKSALNMTHREMMLEGILLIYDKTSPIIVQEKLNSFLPPLQRKSLVSSNRFSSGENAA